MNINSNICCSVIIPAHNEEKTIKRLLDRLRADRDNHVQIIVACNGCSDRTAAVASAYGPCVDVIETGNASKTSALNLGENAAKFWPRIYIDADVIIDVPTILQMVEALKDENFFVAFPSAKTDLDRSNWFVKSFYNIWTRLPYYKEGMIGTGVFALSKSARQRFKKWPDIIADDGFVRALFSRDERKLCRSGSVTVFAPRTLRSLVAAKTRSRLGRYQLNAMFPELMARERNEKQYHKIANILLSEPLLFPAALIYLFVNLTARVRAKMQMRQFGKYTWERDLTTR